MCREYLKYMLSMFARFYYFLLHMFVEVNIISSKTPYSQFSCVHGDVLRYLLKAASRAINCCAITGATAGANTVDQTVSCESRAKLFHTFTHRKPW